MTDEIKQALYHFAAWAGGMVSAFAIQHWRPKQVREDEHDKSQNATIEIQGRTLEGAWVMIEKQQHEIVRQQEELSGMAKKIRELDRDIIKYSRALNRAISFIRANMPKVEVPDFLLDTDPNITKKSPTEW